jgi:hypothetical protein
MDSSARRMAKGIGEVKQVEAKDRTKTKHRDHGGAQRSKRKGSASQILLADHS